MRPETGDSLLQVALAGTSRAAKGPVRTGTTLDELIEKMHGVEPERALLLAAGARAVYRKAGLRPSTLPEAMPAPPEHVPHCPPRVAELLGQFLSEKRDALLLEALERLRLAGMMVPAELLPALLSLRGAALRSALLPVLGQRGIWLAAQNPEWRWVQDYLVPDATAGLVVYQATWEEGAPPQRLTALRRVRTAAPEQARDWIVSAWRGEKAEFRREMLDILSEGLSPADEPLLEDVLNDRAATVRTRAAGLLARLPGSALSVRMRQRADAVLRYETPKEQLWGLRRLASSLSRGGQRGSLHVLPPESLPDDWIRDGIVAKPPQGIGERAWWMQQVLGYVPLNHWNNTLGASPKELVQAVAGNPEWGAVILRGWANALALDAGDAWAEALWESLRGQYGAEKDLGDRSVAWTSLELVMTNMSADQLEPLLRQELVAASGKPNVQLTRGGLEVSADTMSRACSHGLVLVGKPWSADLGETYLRSLRKYLAGARREPFSWPGSWMSTVSHAAEALPYACFDRALEDWRLPGKDDWLLMSWRVEIGNFRSVVRLRKQIAEEIRA